MLEPELRDVCEWDRIQVSAVCLALWTCAKTLSISTWKCSCEKLATHRDGETTEKSYLGFGGGLGMRLKRGKCSKRCFCWDLLAAFFCSWKQTNCAKSHGQDFIRRVSQLLVNCLQAFFLAGPLWQRPQMKAFQEEDHACDTKLAGRDP